MTFDGDGEFYMALEDFLHHFDNLEICNLTSKGIDDEDDDESAKKLSWHESKVEGAWKIGNQGRIKALVGPRPVLFNIFYSRHPSCLKKLASPLQG